MNFIGSLLMIASVGMMATIVHAEEPPVPAYPPNSVVLFQGDSITDMNRGRTLDPNHILGHSYAFLIAARAGEEKPELNLTFYNRGVSGNRVEDMAKRWQHDTLDLKPTILSILIGVNDLNKGVSAEDYAKQYDALLAETVKALPKVRLILCEPFGLPVAKKKEGWDAYLTELQRRQKIVAELAQKYHATLIPLQQVFDEATKRAPADHWIWDGVHPTYSGQQLIANAWQRVVGKMLQGDPG